MNSPNSARLRPFRPQPFGRYTLLSHLATGGMGEIYLARLEGAQGFEKLCVIKKILPQLAEDKEFVDRFVGEARTLVKLSHGSIAQVLDMGLHEGEAYMALEYVDGKDLRKVAGRVRDRQMPLPLTFVLFVMGRVLDALAYAHRKRDDEEKDINLVHRDISPQNILISYEGEVKVIDFGLAKSRLSAAKTNPSIILGKFLYMSPEQARHQLVDRRSDLYAVGLCLYELISGKNPFDAVHSGDLMSAVANPRIAPLNEVEPLTPPAVSQLVMKALAVDPLARFQTAEEFRGRLMGVLMEIDRTAGPESVSRFMREVFAAEYVGERKLLAQLKEVPRIGGPPRTGVELDTDPGARLPVPSLPAKTIKLDPPSQPLSFQPTPRTRTASETETRTGVTINDQPTRPAVSFEALDAAARARVRPPMPSSPSTPTAETVTVEVGPEVFDRPPALPMAAPAPMPPRSSAPTVEVPIPYVPAAAIPPSAPQPTAGTARTLEAPRSAAAPPPPASAPRPPEPPRGAMPPPPAGGAPGPRPGEVPRAPGPQVPIPAGSNPSLKPLEPRAPGPQVPIPTGSNPSLKSVEPRVAGPQVPIPSGSNPSLKPLEPRGATPGQAPAGPPVLEPRSPEVARSYAPTVQSPVTPDPFDSPLLDGVAEMAAPVPIFTPPAAMPVVREAGSPPAPPPVLAEGASDISDIVTAPRELPASMMASRGPQTDPAAMVGRPTEPQLELLPGIAPPRPDPSRRGMDDTHPSYQMVSSGKPPEDTQPRVVLDGAAFQEHPEGEHVILSEELEEISSPSRGKNSRRMRPAPAAQPPAGRTGPPSARSVTRPAEPTPPGSEPAAADDSDPVIIEIEDGGEAEPDSRETTRKPPLPTRPADDRRTEPRRVIMGAPLGQRSVLWLVVSFLLLVVAGAAAVLAIPQLEHLLNLGQQVDKPPPPRPIRPTTPPSGPPGSTPGATSADPAAPSEAPAAAHADPAAPRVAPAAPVAGHVEAAPAPAVVAAAPSPGVEAGDDLLVPLPTAPQAPPKKSTSSRTSKKAPARSTNKEASDLQREWNQTRGYFIKLTTDQSCDSTKIGILCKRYEDLKATMAELGSDSYDKEVHARVRKLRNELSALLRSNP